MNAANRDRADYSEVFLPSLSLSLSLFLNYPFLFFSFPIIITIIGNSIRSVLRHYEHSPCSNSRTELFQPIENGKSPIICYLWFPNPKFGSIFMFFNQSSWRGLILSHFYFPFPFPSHHLFLFSPSQGLKSPPQSPYSHPLQ